jgi:hypothetical protein
MSGRTAEKDDKQRNAAMLASWRKKIAAEVERK